MGFDCGHILDRDRNSDINILIRYLSQNALWACYQLFVGNLRKTGTINNRGYLGILAR